MNIIGLNIFHADTSACLIMDNEIVAAAEEERFVRIKHYSGFPKKSIQKLFSLSSCDHTFALGEAPFGPKSPLLVVGHLLLITSTYSAISPVTPLSLTV